MAKLDRVKIYENLDSKAIQKIAVDFNSKMCRVTYVKRSKPFYEFYCFHPLLVTEMIENTMGNNASIGKTIDHMIKNRLIIKKDTIH